MRTLNLSIRQKYLEAIKDGRKVQEFREIRPNNIKKYLQLDAEGFEIEDENANAIPITYDAILFTSKETGDTALVEVKAARSEIMLDENQQVIEYEYNGQLWVVERVVYDLGRIINHTVTSRT
ncbi:MAG: ASCH domain-containing protein [Prevotella sp.]|nr:ASCH domain-containing protein [Prevotella sp.]